MERTSNNFSSKIIKNDEDFLRQKCDEILLNDGYVVAKHLIDVLKNEPNGAAVAAPQLGILKKVFVTKGENNKFFIYINPIILEKSEPFIFKDEGCLSFPNQKVDTIRYKHIKVKCENELKEIDLLDFDSVCFQHENDHLNGILMFDNLISEAYEECFCGSGIQFKFCCRKKLLKL